MAKRAPRSEANETSVGGVSAKPRAVRAPRASKPRRSVAVAAGPSEDAIRHQAYLRYLSRGGEHGFDFDDWLDAERELKES